MTDRRTYHLYLKDSDNGDHRKRIGTCKLSEEPRVGECLRVSARQARYIDVRLVEIDGSKLVAEPIQGTATFLLLLEQFAYEVLKARRAGVDVAGLVSSMAGNFVSVCGVGATPADCANAQHHIDQVREIMKE
jgi:hypothetical protein